MCQKIFCLFLHHSHSNLVAARKQNLISYSIFNCLSIDWLNLISHFFQVRPSRTFSNEYAFSLMEVHEIKFVISNLFFSSISIQLTIAAYFKSYNLKKNLKFGIEIIILWLHFKLYFDIKVSLSLRNRSCTVYE